MRPMRTGNVVLSVEPKSEKVGEKNRYDAGKKRSIRLSTKNLGDLLMLGKSEYTKTINEFCIILSSLNTL